MFFNLFWEKFSKGAERILKLTALFLIVFYRVFLAALFFSGGACRFYPSCSEYGLLVYKKYPFFKATGLLFKRLLDCRPFGPKLRIEPELTK